MTAKISSSSLIQKTSMVDLKGTKKFEDDITKTIPSNSTGITSITALTSKQFEDAAKKIFQRATKEIRSEWHNTFTSSSSLRSTLVRLQSENESSTVHVFIKNVTEDQIDEALSQLPFRRMTRVCSVPYVFLSLPQLPFRRMTRVCSVPYVFLSLFLTHTQNPSLPFSQQYCKFDEVSESFSIKSFYNLCY